MRNLKRALSLALASVMLMGMMVVGSSAASYPDVSSKHNLEAIEVMQAVGAMSGDETGNFNPDKLVTRNEMAAVITRLLGLDPGNFAGTAMPFTDVPTWAHDYVAAIWTNNITSGTSADRFGGNSKVTAAQAALMMMKALGYFQNPQDFEGGWERATVKQAAEIRLFDGINVATNAPLTRNDVAQLALNALESDVVRFTGDLGIDIDMGNGQSVTVGYKSEYTAVVDYTQLDYNNSGAGHDRDTLQLAEKLYDGDLRKVGVNDAMMRVASEWQYKHVKIGTYAVDPDYTFVVGKNRTLADLIDKEMGTRIDDNTKGQNPAVPGIAYVNGKGASATTGYTTTATNLVVGDIVEVYMTSTNANVVNQIAVTRYSVDRLTGDAATRDDGKEVRLPGVIGWTDVDDVKGYAGLVDDDVVYFYQDNDNVYHFAKAASFDGKLTAINNKTPNTYVVDGATYTANGSMSPAAMNMSTPVFNTQYRFWTDNNGYVIYGDELEDALSDYIVIQDIEYIDGTGVSRDGKVEARIVKMDGTTEVVEINSIKTSGTVYSDISDTAANANSNKPSGEEWLAFGRVNVALNATLSTTHEDKTFFTYEKNSDGTYDLTYVHGQNITAGSANNATLNAGKVTAGGSNIGVNDKTVFVVNQKPSAQERDAKFDAFIGKNKAPDLTGADISYIREGGVVTHMYINKYATKSFSGDYVFFLKNSPEKYNTAVREDGTKYGFNEYMAIVNGEYELVKVRANKPNNNLANGGNNNLTGSSDPVAIGLFVPTYDDDGVITGLDADPNNVSSGVMYGYMVDGTSLYTDKNGAAGQHYAGTYYFDEDTAPVFVMNADGDEVVDNGLINNLDADSNDRIYVVVDSTGSYEAKFAVIIEADPADKGLEIVGDVNGMTLVNNGRDGSSKANAIQYNLDWTSGAVQIVADDAVHIAVKYTTNNSADWTSMTAANTVTPTSATGYIAIDVTESDGSHTYYEVKVQ